MGPGKDSYVDAYRDSDIQEAAKRVKHANPIIPYVEGIVGEPGRGDGEWVTTRCPFPDHEDKQASFRICEDGGWHCLSSDCGHKGHDVIELVKALHGIEFIAAMKMLGYEPVPSLAPPRPQPFEEYDLPKVGETVSLRMHGRDKNGMQHGNWDFQVDQIHHYHRANARLTQPILRKKASKKNRKKSWTCTAIRWDGSEWWACVNDPPLLWNLPGIGRKNRTVHQILIVEGEQAAEAAHAAMKGQPITVTTWQGGGNKVGYSDWSVMAGRRVIVWPDADKAGMKTADALVMALQEIGCAEIKRVRIDHTDPKGQDAADIPAEDIDAFLRDRVELVSADSEAVPAEQEPEQKPETKPDPEPDPEPEQKPAFRDPRKLRREKLERDDAPFIILGTDASVVFFLLKESGYIIAYSPKEISKQSVLVTIGSPDWWRKVFGGLNEEGKPVSWSTIGANASWAINQHARSRPFNLSRVRGRGAWLEKGRHVYNAGDAVYCEGVKREGHYHEGFVYSPGVPLEYSPDDIATDAECRQVRQVLERCSWEEPSSALLLAGWIGIAPVCGALEWRPHVWITGDSGTGKTTIRNDIVAACLGDLAVVTSGSTTEAGIRGDLQSDALPVLIDEAENNHHKSTIEGLMDLARASSSGDIIKKGTASGGSVAYVIRSVFCFSAVHTSVKKAADASRISKLILRKSGTDADFQHLKRMISTHISPEFSRRLVARMISLTDKIRTNAATFGDAVSTRYGSRRIADQIGTLLAGAYAMERSDLVTEEDASAWVNSLSLAQQDRVSDANEGATILEALGAYVVKMGDGDGFKEASINELIDICAAPFARDKDKISKLDAEKHLKRHGIRVEKDTTLMVEIWVAYDHPELRRKVFKGMPWATDYSEHLRSEATGRVGGQVRYGPGKKYSTTVIPIDVMIGEGEDYDEQARRDSGWSE